MSSMVQNNCVTHSVMSFVRHTSNTVQNVKVIFMCHFVFFSLEISFCFYVAKDDRTTYTLSSPTSYYHKLTKQAFGYTYSEWRCMCSTD